APPRRASVPRPPPLRADRSLGLRAGPPRAAAPGPGRARRLSPITMVQLLAPLREDPIAAVPWHGAEAPSRVLVIRLQAFGDTVATLPYIAALKRLWARTEFDLLTRQEVADLPRSVDLFTIIFALLGGRDWRRQL